MIKSTTIFLFAFLTFLLLITSCSKTTNEDKSLYEKVKSDAGFAFYKNNTTVLQSSGSSPHNAYFRMRYNSIAINAMTDNGKLPGGGSFPEGSLVVKELYDSPTGSLKLLAVMEKASQGSTGADGNGQNILPMAKQPIPLPKKGKVAFPAIPPIREIITQCLIYSPKQLLLLFRIIYAKSGNCKTV
jgi:hypothetical protein